MARRLAASGPAEIVLADTIGVAVPAQVSALIAAVRAVIGAIPIRAHFHNTRNTGIANVWAAVEAGATTIDAAIGGLGGCPFAPGAAGNVSTEDVVYMLERAGISTALDLDRLVDLVLDATDLLGRVVQLGNGGGHHARHHAAEEGSDECGGDGQSLHG